MSERFRQFPKEQAPETPKNEEFEFAPDETPGNTNQSEDEKLWEQHLKKFEELSRQKLQEENKKESRRAFLKKMGKGLATVGVGLAAGGLGDYLYQSHLEQQEKESAEASLLQFERGLSSLVVEYTKKYGDYYSRSMAEEELVREEFLKTPAAAQTGKIAEIAGKSKDINLLLNIVSKLTFFNVQGRFFRAVENSGGPINCSYSDLFSSKMVDFVPKEIDDEFIDPRRIVLLQTKNYPDLSSDVRETIEKTPGWSDAELQRKFRELANNPEVLKLGKEADLTLAEYYSLVKAVIKFKKAVYEQRGDIASLRAYTEMSDETVASMLLKEREKFCKTKLLSEDTESCISFNGYDKKPDDKKFFVGDNVDKIAEASGVPKESMHRLDATTDHGRNFEDSLRLYSTITNSKGKTFIILNTHGNPEKMSIDATSANGDSNNIMRYETIADSLVKRAIDQRDPKTLAEVTLCIDSCHSYDLAKNIATEMNKIWEKESKKFRELKGKKLALPTIITATQEGSLSYRQSNINWILEKQKEGIRKDGALYGARILKKAQPLTYEWNDFTVFTEVLGKYYTEIAEAEKTHDKVPV